MTTPAPVWISMASHNWFKSRRKVSCITRSCREKMADFIEGRREEQYGPSPYTARGSAVIVRRAEQTMTPRIEIEYCTQCRWLLRAAWMAQELLTTFEKE